MHARNAIYLPQTITYSLNGSSLSDALRDDDFPSFRDRRNNPGTVDRGHSMLRAERDSAIHPTTHPVPRYKSSLPIEHIDYNTWGGRVDVDVIPATTTPMSPPVARAFLGLLADDPTHPFVETHLRAGIDLNGSDSYLTVGGPALAVPLTWVEPPEGRAGWGFVEPESEGEIRELPIHVVNENGITIEDFMAAARRHESLSADQVLVSPADLVQIRAVDHYSSGKGLKGREVPMFRLSENERTLGLYSTAQEAQAALEEAVEFDRYPDATHLSPERHRPNFDRLLEVNACVAVDGVEVRSADLRVGTELVEAGAVMRARVETLPRSRRGTVVGWMLQWRVPNWHRNDLYLTQYEDADGAVVGHRYHYGFR